MKKTELIQRAESMKKNGYTEVEIAEHLRISTVKLRSLLALNKASKQLSREKHPF